MRCSWKQFVISIVSRTLSKFQFYLARSAKDLGRGAWRWGDGNGEVDIGFIGLMQKCPQGACTIQNLNKNEQFKGLSFRNSDARL